MNFEKEANRIFARNEEGKVIAEITFPEREDGVWVIDHTYVDASLRGQGIAGKLVEMAITQAKEQGRTIEATCSFARQWIANKAGTSVEI